MDTSNLLLLLLIFLRCAKGSNRSCVKILPDSSSRIPVELGAKFTATCYLEEGSRYTSDDIEWTMADVTISKQLYHKINETAVSVTVDVSSEMNGWLKCRTSRNSFSYTDPCVYGIDLHPGYRPLKPTNFTCIALQKDSYISSDLTCYWDPGARDPKLRTTYILYAEIPYDKQYKEVCEKNPPGSCTVKLSTFPVHMDLKVWLEVMNGLGTEKSDELIKNSANFVKPDPPLDIKVFSEVNFSTTLFMTWKDPMDRDTLKLLYAIRYCQAGSGVWIEVPENITQDSFRLQNLNPDTEYVVQMRSTGKRDGTYWSDWSANVTARTAEAKPASPPDLWRIIQKTSSENRNVTFLWKPPVKANGKILEYSLVTTKDYETFEGHFVKADNFIQMYSMELQRDEIVNVEITARNSAGKSPNASLFISRQNYERPGVENMNWWAHDGKLQVEWTAVPPHLHKGARLSEYLLEWQNENELQPNWQRVPANVNSTTITGDLTDFKRYSLSVYPVYKHHSQWGWHFQAGKPKTKPAYIRQGSPEEGPVSDAKYKKNSAVLTWKEIPVNAQRGFIKNYTIFYKPVNADQWTSDTVAANIHEYVLTDLLGERDYVVRIMASTEAGSKNGSDLTFKTLKYGDGEVEVIVVLVCLSFLFLSVFIIMLCLRKREVIKKLLWPQVPDPSDSSIAHWSPDFPVKADMPKEDVSVVEVDVFDGKSLCEEDKGMLPLKKDKYLSEEHSSGIGGSSCMSSPRHSVSDSDEGDSGQTTASTVQYSSVMASGYKGQTPNHQPVFARSESTQPLLDSEEHPDHLSESHGRNSYFRRGRELEPGVLVQECDEPSEGSLTFCPVQEEEASPDVEDPATALSYMPQKSGYRPQQN